MTSFRGIGAIVLLALLPLACGPRQPDWKFNPSFYYWKTSIQLDGKDLERLNRWGVKRLYLRFFDVSWDPRLRATEPLQVLRVQKGCLLPEEVVPVVFLTREAVENTKNRGRLAGQVVSLVSSMAKKMGRGTVRELQMDFDWTPSTRGAFFDLLALIRAEMKKTLPEAALTCTIRLHQVKYMKSVGVPPVDKGALMVYHTSSPTKLDPKDSILDLDEAKSYLRNVDRYPLALDVALPMFSWAVQFNASKRFVGIVSDVGEADFSKDPAYEKAGPRIYRAVKDAFAGNRRVMTGDLLKVDEPGLQTVRKALKFNKIRLKNQGGNLILYHYDESVIRRFTRGDPNALGGLLAL